MSERCAQNKNPLPDLYEEFLHQQSLLVSDKYVRGIRTHLFQFHTYLKDNHIKLPSLTIEHADSFMATFKVARITHKNYRHRLKGFLNFLYHEKKILKKDLAPLLVGAPLFAYKKPPRFLRHQEVQKLFSSLELSTPLDIRTYAIIHLTYALGLRPIEISRITLDDVSFTKEEITLRERKTKNPTTLPLPKQTIKAIAAYVYKARPKTALRTLFLTHSGSPLQSVTVSGAIRKAMKKAGLSSSAYWLRHTYAQNLLGLGRSIYEIKEMMGHKNIQSTQRYLHIDTEKMRKVLFDETL